jgi:hypothetical protein
MVKLTLLGMLVSVTASGFAFAQPQALLIGVSGYPTLPLERRLKGPANDVRLMHHALRKNGFSESNITVLADQVSLSKDLPTKRNIVAEFDRLLKTAKSGDWVVLYLTGHGSQQPQKFPIGDGRYPEPDGLDEMFLPIDVGRWSDAQATVERSLLDDEIRFWVDSLTKKGVRVWAILDTCHSGGLSKGSFDSADEGAGRSVTPSLLGIPSDLMSAARTRARALPTFTAQQPINKNAIFFHASQKDEPSSEELLVIPRDHNDIGPAGERRYFGLFTYHVALLLREGVGSFSELAQKIGKVFAKRPFPTPLIEGSNDLLSRFLPDK